MNLGSDQVTSTATSFGPMPIGSPMGSAMDMAAHVAAHAHHQRTLFAAHHAAAAAAAAAAGIKPQDLNSSNSSNDGETPMSKTSQYKKVMKPLLERKRRARINKCLDELKEIMTTALQAEGENVSKLEKADILELTVRHLQKLQQSRRLMFTRSPLEEVQRYHAGYTSCAQEAASFLLTAPGVDVRVSQRLLSHLGSSTAINPIQAAAAAAASARLQNRTPVLGSPPLPTSPRVQQPPQRPSSTPSFEQPLSHQLTVSIRRASDDESDVLPRRRASISGGAGMPIKPEAIRLKAGDPVWRPF